MKVAVCVCTFRRPRSLDRLLAALAGQRFDGEPPAVDLVVVDNDSDGPARPIVERWAERIGWPVRYVVEPRRGIPIARNRALAEAPDDADVIAFVDDDDWPDAEWLYRLLDGLERYDAAVATGPQLPVYPEGIPDWIARGDLFEGRRRPTGTPVEDAYTHNVAFRTDVLSNLDGGFDEGLAWQGHDDTDFFRRIERAGHEMVWIDEAVVINPVSPKRATARWLLRRFFRFGIGNALVQRRHDEPLGRRLVRAGKMAGRLAVSPFRVLARLHEGRAALLRLTLDWVFPVGYLLGWFGFTYEEYRHHEYPEAEGARTDPRFRPTPDPGAERRLPGPDGRSPPTGGAPTRVAVCVCTFRRPASLPRLLRSLADQRFGEEPPELELVVVDNDPDGSARPVVERWTERIDGAVRYAVEPRRGIPHARNRALAEASDEADVIAILDDDQWAGSGWLEALLEGLVRHDADVVTGPRLPVYPGNVPGWVARAGLFAGTRWPSGREVRIAYTHNVAFRTGILDELESWFDEALVGTGGSDTDFFHRVRLLGKRMVWIDEAVTFEPVPDSRASARWIVRRFYRFGTTAGLLQRRRETRLVGTLNRTGRALGRGLLAPLRLAALPHRGRGAAVRAAADVAFSAGFLMGVAGFGYDEYRRRRQGGADPIREMREKA